MHMVSLETASPIYKVSDVVHKVSYETKETLRSHDYYQNHCKTHNALECAGDRPKLTYK